MKPSAGQRRHFHVAARELLLDAPQRCPFLPTLTMDGLAVTPQGQHHLILTLAGVDRMYVGPDQRTVARRAQILTMALHEGVAAVDRFHADLVGDWVTMAWAATIDELVDAIAATDLADADHRHRDRLHGRAAGRARRRPGR